MAGRRRQLGRRYPHRRLSIARPFAHRHGPQCSYGRPDGKSPRWSLLAVWVCFRTRHRHTAATTVTAAAAQATTSLHDVYLDAQGGRLAIAVFVDTSAGPQATDAEEAVLGPLVGAPVSGRLRQGVTSMINANRTERGDVSRKLPSDAAKVDLTTARLTPRHIATTPE